MDPQKEYRKKLKKARLRLERERDILINRLGLAPEVAAEIIRIAAARRPYYLRPRDAKFEM